MSAQTGLLSARLHDLVKTIRLTADALEPVYPLLLTQLDVATSEKRDVMTVRTHGQGPAVTEFSAAHLKRRLGSMAREIERNMGLLISSSIRPDESASVPLMDRIARLVVDINDAYTEFPTQRGCCLKYELRQQCHALLYALANGLASIEDSFSTTVLPRTRRRSSLWRIEAFHTVLRRLNGTSEDNVRATCHYVCTQYTSIVDAFKEARNVCLRLLQELDRRYSANLFRDEIDQLHTLFCDHYRLWRHDRRGRTIHDFLTDNEKVEHDERVDRGMHIFTDPLAENDTRSAPSGLSDDDETTELGEDVEILEDPDEGTHDDSDSDDNDEDGDGDGDGDSGNRDDEMEGSHNNDGEAGSDADSLHPNVHDAAMVDPNVDPSDTTRSSRLPPLPLEARPLAMDFEPGQTHYDPLHGERQRASATVRRPATLVARIEDLYGRLLARIVEHTHQSTALPRPVRGTRRHVSFRVTDTQRRPQHEVMSSSDDENQETATEAPLMEFGFAEEGIVRATTLRAEELLRRGQCSVYGMIAVSAVSSFYHRFYIECLFGIAPAMLDDHLVGVLDRVALHSEQVAALVDELVAGFEVEESPVMLAEKGDALSQRLSNLLTAAEALAHYTVHDSTVLLAWLRRRVQRVDEFLYKLTSLSRKPLAAV